MDFPWFGSTFLTVLKFLQIKDGGPNLLGEPILQNVWIIWSPLLQIKEVRPNFWLELILQNI